MRLKCLNRGNVLTVERKDLIGGGGQADVFAVSDDSTLAVKVYHKFTPELMAKLRAMIQNPPKDSMAAKGHASIAWPIDLVVDEQVSADPIGFLMPRVNRVRPVIDFFNPKTRKDKCPGFNYLYLHRTARNLATAVHALHSKGYVVGDVNESNILVSDSALVTLVDVDSFQVKDTKTGTVYRCPVGRADMTPAELLKELNRGKPFQELDRGAEQDLFGLAAVIFQLLMEGTHPYAGVFTGEGDPPQYADRIAAGHFPYSPKQGVPYTPMKMAPSFLSLHPTLRDLFMKCFVEGHGHPSARPTALQWQQALDETGNLLVVCKKNPQHYYWQQARKCPWCDRTEKLGGRDPFPPLETEIQEAVAPDSQLNSVNIRPVSTAGLRPRGESKLRLATRRQFVQGSEKGSLLGWLLKLPGLNQLQGTWASFEQTPNGQHVAHFLHLYTFLVVALLALFVGFLFTSIAWGLGLAVTLAGIIWFASSGGEPFKKRWPALGLALVGIWMFLHYFPWAKVMAWFKSLTPAE